MSKVPRGILCLCEKVSRSLSLRLLKETSVKLSSTVDGACTSYAITLWPRRCNMSLGLGSATELVGEPEHIGAREDILASSLPVLVALVDLLMVTILSGILK